MSAVVACGIAAGVVATVDSIPYVRNVLAGRTQPHRGTWCIWTVLGVTAFFSHASDGGTWILVMLGAEAAAVTVVFALSITCGVGGLGRADLVLLGVALLGVAGWAMTDRAIVATACVILADLAGAILMLPKAWRRPETETALSFSLAALAGGLGVLAVGSAQPELAIYPGYFAVVNAVIAGVIVSRRRVLAASSAADVVQVMDDVVQAVDTERGHGEDRAVGSPPGPVPLVIRNAVIDGSEKVGGGGEFLGDLSRIGLPVPALQRGGVLVPVVEQRIVGGQHRKHPTTEQQHHVPDMRAVLQ